MIMPRRYLNVSLGDHVPPDPEGLSCSHIAAGEGVFVVSWIPDSIPRRFAPLHASGKRAEVLALGPPPFSRRVKRAQRSNPVRDPELGLAFRESRSPEGQDPRDPDA